MVMNSCAISSLTAFAGYLYKTPQNSKALFYIQSAFLLIKIKKYKKAIDFCLWYAIIKV